MKKPPIIGGLNFRFYQGSLARARTARKIIRTLIFTRLPCVPLAHCVGAQYIAGVWVGSAAAVLDTANTCHCHSALNVLVKT